MTEAVRVAGVVSVAMFNRNPGISDSPVDCPEDPAMYLNQTFVKLRCCVEAAAELNADVMVVPDVGCGVFHNDPRIIGGCFGRAIRECGANLPAVVITTHNEDFNEAFLRALHGEDPRPTCRLGGYCPNLGDPKHAACFAHEGVELNSEGQDPVLAALMLLAEYPKVIAKPMCRYGFACTQTRNPRHMEKFDHPSADDQDRKVGRGRPAGAERGRAPQQPPLDRVPSAGRRRQPVTPSGDSIGAAHGALGAQPRERCKYGEKCFRTAADHKREFSHPGDPDWDCHPSAFGHTASYGPSSGGR